jgi:hypothetical protein
MITVSIVSTRIASARFASGLGLHELPRLLLDRRDNFGPLAAESLAVHVLDKLRERLLPGLLTVVVELAELPGVQAELTRHLNMGMRQPVPSARVCPGL